MQITAIILAIMAVLVVVFVVKKQILLGADFMLKALFVLAMAICVIGLFWAAPFTALADNSLQSVGLLSSFQSIDARIESLNPQNILDGIDDFFSGRNEETEVEPVQPGYFEAEVYAGMVAALTDVYRGLAVFLSLAVMLLLVYLSYATFGASASLKLERRIHHLEQELDELKKGQPTQLSN